MDSPMMRKMKITKRGRKSISAAGFTLLEAMIAMCVLSFGILGLAAMMTDGVAYMNMSQADFIAQQKAEAAVESIFYARDSQLYTFAQIQNVSNGGIFVDGQNPLVDPGPDGIIDTADDYVNPVYDVIIAPGQSGILGGPDDIKMPLGNFTRQIIISNVANEPYLREITVIIRYTAGRFKRTYTLVSYISAFS
jgi:hypothetical protein